MAEKSLQVYPLAPANGNPRSDQESAYLHSKELKKKKRLKCFAYIVLFAVFQTLVILTFALIVMKIKTPKVRFGTETVQASNLVIGTAASGFNMSLAAKLTVENTNFGHYKFDQTTGTITYEGVKVGEFMIPKARARARSTKKIDIVADVNSNTLNSDHGTGFLTLNSQAKLTGKVILMKVMKKKRSAEMSCSLVIDVNRKVVSSVMCK